MPRESTSHERIRRVPLARGFARQCSLNSLAAQSSRQGHLSAAHSTGRDVRCDAGCSGQVSEKSGRWQTADGASFGDGDRVQTAIGWLGVTLGQCRLHGTVAGVEAGGADCIWDAGVRMLPDVVCRRLLWCKIGSMQSAIRARFCNVSAQRPCFQDVAFPLLERTFSWQPIQSPPVSMP